MASVGVIEKALSFLYVQSSCWICVVRRGVKFRLGRLWGISRTSHLLFLWSLLIHFVPFGFDGKGEQLLLSPTNLQGTSRQGLLLRVTPKCWGQLRLWWFHFTNRQCSTIACHSNPKPRASCTNFLAHASPTAASAQLSRILCLTNVLDMRPSLLLLRNPMFAGDQGLFVHRSALQKVR